MGVVADRSRGGIGLVWSFAEDLDVEIRVARSTLR